MKRNQSGFTLIEIAIVLVIIGLLLVGVMKGQELINSAKVKNLEADFKNTLLSIYGYQDKYKALPGDDLFAASHVSGAMLPTTTTYLGNGRIDGAWDSASTADESYLFWQHIRLAGIATGVTTPSDTAGYPQRNTQGRIIGITNSSTDASFGKLPIAGLKGAYIICSGSIPGKFAKQLDIAMDDGNTATGSVMAATTAPAAVGATAAAAENNADDAQLYTVCMGV